jgi:hypothetical protein
MLTQYQNNWTYYVTMVMNRQMSQFYSEKWATGAHFEFPISADLPSYGMSLYFDFYQIPLQFVSHLYQPVSNIQ